jgi:hypothetical protein
LNSITVTGYDYQWAQQADLELYLQTYRPDLPSNITFALQEVDGGLDEQYPDEAGGEADMDIELTVGRMPPAAFSHSLSACLQVGLSNGIPVTFLSAGITAIPKGFHGLARGSHGVYNVVVSIKRHARYGITCVCKLLFGKVFAREQQAFKSF